MLINISNVLYASVRVVAFFGEAKFSSLRLGVNAIVNYDPRGARGGDGGLVAAYDMHEVKFRLSNPI